MRVHTGSEAAKTAQQINSQAFTSGRDIVFAPGRYQPQTPDGQRLLAHELTHVMQQSGPEGINVGQGNEKSNHPPVLRWQVQRTPDAEASAEKKVGFQISFHKPLKREEFIDLAERTIYGRRMTNFVWTGVKEIYTPAESPVWAFVPAHTLQGRLKDYGESVGKVIKGIDKVQDAATYQRMNKIIQKLTPDQWADYEKRVTGKVENLDDFEKSVDAYLSAQKQRQVEFEQRDQLVQKLYGLESLYQQYTDWKSITGVSSDQEQKFKDNLKTSGFPGGIPDFEKFIQDYLIAFRTETIKIGLDILQQYDSVLYKEGLRYQDPVVVAALHKQLAPLRTEMPQFEKSAKIYNDFVRDEAKRKELSRLPGNAGMPEIPQERKNAAAVALADAEKHKEAARQSVISISSDFPVLKEDPLPLNRRLDKIAMARADPTQLMALLKSHIEARREDIKLTRESLASDPDKIFSLDNLIEASKERQKIDAQSIFANIINERASAIRKKDIIIGVIVGVFAIALTIVSLGSGAIALGAAIGAFGLSAGMAYQEYKAFEEKEAAYGSGMASDEPSPVWLVISVVGAAVDLGAAVKAVRAISPLAKTLEATGDAAKFTEGLKALEKSGAIDAKIARSAEQAGIARAKSLEAVRGLGRTLKSKAYSFPGPIADPDVYRDVVKLAYYKFKEAGFNFIQFAEEIKQARAAAKLADLSSEELTLLKKAYDEGKAFATEADLLKYMRRKPLSGKSIVLDENMLIARHKDATGIALQEGEKRMVAYLKANSDAKLTVPEEVYDKVLGKMDTSDLSIIESTAKSGSTEYSDAMKVLEQNTVGAAKGAEDRRLILETLFAKVESGVTPTFVTHDPGIYKRMYMIGQTDPEALKKLGKSLPEAFPGGFDVIINGKTLKVIPIPKK